MTARILNTIGLSLGIAGVLVIFCWGPPQPDFDPNSHILAEGPPNQSVLAEKEKYRGYSKIGLGLIGVGFIFQIAALWVPVRRQGENMDAFLDELETEWRRIAEYKDVKAEYWVPGQAQLKTCPIGCELETYDDTPSKWVRMSGRDAYRQTRICRKHGFARIYVISGPTAAAVKWNPTNSQNSLET